MPNCSANMTLINKPGGGPQKCGGCGDSGVFDCGNLKRPNRDRVIERLKDYVLLKLGAPIIEIELDDQQLDMLVKEVLKWVEYYAPRDFYTYHTFVTTPGQSVYRMPDDVGYIREVNYRTTPEFAFQSTDLQGALPVEYFYPGGAYSSIQGGLIDPIQPIWGRASEWYIYKSYEKLYANMSSAIGGWEWLNGYRHIKLFPIPFRSYHVSVHYIQKCKDWEDVELMMLDGVTANVKMTLGRILRKYKNIPGPAGGVQLDGPELVQEGKEEWERWKDDLLNRFGEVYGPTAG